MSDFQRTSSCLVRAERVPVNSMFRKSDRLQTWQFLSAANCFTRRTAHLFSWERERERERALRIGHPEGVKVRSDKIGIRCIFCRFFVLNFILRHFLCKLLANLPSVNAFYIRMWFVWTSFSIYLYQAAFITRPHEHHLHNFLFPILYRPTPSVVKKFCSFLLRS